MRLAAALTLIVATTTIAAAQGSPAPDACVYDAAAPRAQVTGKILDPSGAPLVGASLTLRCGSFRQDARTIGDGSYTMAAPAGSYILEAEAPGFEPTAASVTLAAAAPAALDLTLEIGTFGSIITVSEPGGFVASSSTSATKSDAPLIEIPQSVSVITLDQMTARNVQSVASAISYTASVDVNTFGTETRFDWINIRGFDQSTYGLYRDNSRWQSGQVSGQIDPYMLQEIDVVKGPSSVLYGQNQPGGLVNLVTKRPPSQQMREVVLNYGSYDRMQAQADFGGPIGDDGKLKYRLTGLWRNSDTQVDFVSDDRYFIAPALTFTPSDKTTWTLLGDFQHDETGWSQFLPSQGTLTSNPHGDIDRSLFVGEPDYDYFDRDQWSAGSLFEYRINDKWALRNTLRYSSIEFDGKTVFGGGLQNDQRSLNRFGFGNTFDLKIFTMDTNAYARFDSGSVEHSLLFGVDYSTSESKIISGFSFAAPLDVFNPVYGSSVPDLFIYGNVNQPIDQIGVYAQDQMKFAERWIATVALREDTNDTTTENLLSHTSVDQSDNALTGRVALTYLADSGLAPYVSYSTSFLPVAGVDFYNRPYDPTEGEQIEGGLKFQPKGSNSFLTASLFQITQTNVSVPDPVNPFSSVQQGEIRSRGIELEAIGSLATSFNYYASYSYLDQEVTATTDPATLGKRPPLAPDQLFSAGGEYMFTQGGATGLGLGAGVRYVGSRAGDGANTIEVGSYTLFDASVRYLWRSMEFLVSATNLTDKTYVGVCQSVNYCNYGIGREAIATVRFHF